MIVLLLTGQEVNLEKCPLFPVRHMPAGCISIRSIILTRERTQMPAEDGTQTGSREEKRLILRPRHSKKSTGG